MYGILHAGRVGPQERSTAIYAEALGWPADAWQRLIDGADPADLSAETANRSEIPTDSDLRDLLGVGGQIVRDELDEIKARLDGSKILAARTRAQPAP